MSRANVKSIEAIRDFRVALIKFAEGRGWVSGVKWPKPERVEAKLARPATMGS